MCNSSLSDYFCLTCIIKVSIFAFVIYARNRTSDPQTTVNRNQWHVHIRCHCYHIFAWHWICRAFFILEDRYEYDNYREYYFFYRRCTHGRHWLHKDQEVHSSHTMRHVWLDGYCKHHSRRHDRRDILSGQYNKKSVLSERSAVCTCKAVCYSNTDPAVCQGQHSGLDRLASDHFCLFLHMDDRCQGWDNA